MRLVCRPVRVRAVKPTACVCPVPYMGSLWNRERREALTTGAARRKPPVPTQRGTIVLIAGSPAGAWGTNCYLVAPAAGEECVIIVPGHQAADGVAEAVRKYRLKPVAVVLTHGH